MDVWIAWSGEHDERDVRGVFATRDAALANVKRGWGIGDSDDVIEKPPLRWDEERAEYVTGSDLDGPTVIERGGAWRDHHVPIGEIQRFTVGSEANGE